MQKYIYYCPFCERFIIPRKIKLKRQKDRRKSKHRCGKCHTTRLLELDPNTAFPKIGNLQMKADDHHKSNIAADKITELKIIPEIKRAWMHGTGYTPPRRSLARSVNIDWLMARYKYSRDKAEDIIDALSLQYPPIAIEIDEYIKKRHP